jgi:hypothetical protein
MPRRCRKGHRFATGLRLASSIAALIVAPFRPERFDLACGLRGLVLLYFNP